MRNLITVITFLLLYSIFWVYFYSNTLPDNDSVACRFSILASTDSSMLLHVKNSIKVATQAGCSSLQVEIFSGGGPVATSIEISHELRRVRLRGMRVVTIGRSFVASGATIVLSAGTPGYRYITKNSIVLVHGVQIPNGPFSFQMTCVGINLTDKDENTLIINQVIRQVAREYAFNTGKSIKETSRWLACDNSLVGDGNLAIKLGLADHISE